MCDVPLGSEILEMTLSGFQMTFSRGRSLAATTSQQFWSFYRSRRQRGLVFRKGFGGCQSAEPPGPLMGDSAWLLTMMDVLPVLIA